MRDEQLEILWGKSNDKCLNLDELVNESSQQISTQNNNLSIINRNKQEPESLISASSSNYNPDSLIELNESFECFTTSNFKDPTLYLQLSSDYLDKKMGLNLRKNSCSDSKNGESDMVWPSDQTEIENCIETGNDAFKNMSYKKENPIDCEEVLVASTSTAVKKNYYKNQKSFHSMNNLSTFNINFISSNNDLKNNTDIKSTREPIILTDEQLAKLPINQEVIEAMDSLEFLFSDLAFDTFLQYYRRHKVASHNLYHEDNSYVTSSDFCDPVSQQSLFRSVKSNQKEMTQLTKLINSLTADETIIQRIDHSIKFTDEIYEYRFVILPRDHPIFSSSCIEKFRNNLFTESEWRALGIRQTRGWEHFGYSPYESNVLLFRRPLVDDRNALCKSTNLSNRINQMHMWEDQVVEINNSRKYDDASSLPIFGSMFPLNNNSENLYNQQISNSELSNYHYYNEQNIETLFNVVSKYMSAVLADKNLVTNSKLHFIDTLSNNLNKEQKLTKNEVSEKEKFMQDINFLYASIHVPLFDL